MGSCVCSLIICKQARILSFRGKGSVKKNDWKGNYIAEALALAGERWRGQKWRGEGGGYENDVDGNSE